MHAGLLQSALTRGVLAHCTDYPISLGAEHTAAKLISPDAASPTRPDAQSIWAPKEEAPKPEPRLLGGKNGKPPPVAESGYVLAQRQQAQALITAPQSDRIARTPALTTLQAERVAADSSRRYFHARDYSEQPFLSSNKYYEDDVRAPPKLGRLPLSAALAT